LPIWLIRLFGIGFLVLSANQKRVIALYVIVQAVLWAKNAVFFFTYGHGKVVREIRPIVPSEISVLDFVFHFLVHVIIAVLAIAFGKNLLRFDFFEILTVVAIAVLLHDVGYWLTRSHPGVIYSILDFGLDCALLLSAIFAGFILSRHKKIAALKIPFIEK